MSNSNVVVFGSVRHQPPIYNGLLKQAANRHKGNPFRPEVHEIVTRCWRFLRITGPTDLPCPAASPEKQTAQG